MKNLSLIAARTDEQRRYEEYITASALAGAARHTLLAAELKERLTLEAWTKARDKVVAINKARKP